MTATFETVVATVRDRVDPTAEERDRLESTVEHLIERTEIVIDERDIEAEVRHVGSTARDTWLADERDIDLFIRFPTELSRAKLEELGLAIGHDVLDNGQEEYAEHPYVTGTVDGFDVDLVPCYAVDTADQIISTVDRTPFHNQYISDRLTETLAGDVRIFKGLLSGIGVYGSNLRTRGFSGYLTELLVVEFGGFRPVVEAIADWQPPVQLDPAGHGRQPFDDPLTVIDPTDPNRNVAAVLSAENLARCQHHTRQLLKAPSVDRFFPSPVEPTTPDTVRTHLAERYTTPIALVFEKPSVVDDNLYPQLRKSVASIGTALNRQGFDLLRKQVFVNERVVLWFELAVAERPAVERHAGPPTGVRSHAEEFYETYADASVYGPFIDGDRYVVERDRPFRTAVDWFQSDALLTLRHGAAVETALDDDFDLLVGDDVAQLATEFGRELAAYFDPSP